MKDKMRMSANISAVFSGIVASQDLRRSGHDDIHMQAGYNTQQQAGHDITQARHDVTQTGHYTQQQAGHEATQTRHDIAQVRYAVTQTGHYTQQQAGHEAIQAGHDITQARYDITQAGHEVMQIGHDTQQQAGHDATQTKHDTLQSHHDTQPIIADNVPAGRDDAANFWGGYVSSYPGGTRPGNQSRYELYIGFLHEKWGWNVEYNRIIPGEDRIRRGLICRKEDKVRVVHCLFRPSNNIIHAGFIYLLFAMAWEFKHDWPNLKVSARFFTPASLDIKARESADKFSVKASEHFPFKDFPYIKCITEQRIFYTPYDNGYFTAKGGERLATIQQAISQGFIHGV